MTEQPAPAPAPRREQARLWLIDHLPAGLLWHPAEWFLALLCALSGVLSLFTPVETRSLEALLPHPFLRVWGVLLVVGAIALASGLASIRHLEQDRYVVTRVPAYRLGLRLLGLSTTVYIGAIILYAGWAGLAASIIPAAFVAMCGVRLLTLGGRQ